MSITSSLPCPEEGPFEQWFKTKGLRYFAKNHGSALGHEEYMYEAFSAGYKAALEAEFDANDISNAQDQ